MSRIRFFWYVVTRAGKDTWNAKWSLVANVCIVAGICLPALVLLGLQRGLVAQFRNNIEKSPTARQIQTWVTQEGEGRRFTPSNDQQLQSKVPEALLVIPDIHGNGWLSAGSQTDLIPVELATTMSGDPFLDFYGADVLKPGDRGVVLSRDLADSLKIPYRRAGERGFQLEGEHEIRVSVQRGGEATKQSFSAAVRGIFSRNNEAGDPLPLATAYFERQVMDWLEDFKKGRSVVELGLKGSKVSPKPSYDGYLAFSKQAFTAKVTQRLQGRGLKAVPVEQTRLADSPSQLRRLYGLLKPHQLFVYWIFIDYGTQAKSFPVDHPPKDVEELTSEVDAVIVPWSRTRQVHIDGLDHRLLGLSLNGKWLTRQYYLRNPKVRLESTAETFEAMTWSLRSSSNLPKSGLRPVTWKPGETVAVQVLPTPPATKPIRLQRPDELAWPIMSLSFPLPVRLYPLGERVLTRVGKAFGIPAKTHAALYIRPPSILLQVGGDSPPPPSLPTFELDELPGGDLMAVGSVQLTQAVARQMPRIPQGIAWFNSQSATMSRNWASRQKDRVEVFQSIGHATVNAWRSARDIRNWGGRLTAALPQTGLLNSLRTLGTTRPMPLLVVSASLGAYLARTDDGILEYDVIQNQFTPARVDNEYTKALIYANKLESVPMLDTALRSMGYSVTSARTSVEEMQGYVHTLDVLVFWVLFGVLVFGCLTVLFVFWDVTGRKRGAIGIMRLMGMPAPCVFLFVIVRSLLVGVFATVGTLLFGFLFAACLTHFRNVACRIDWSQDVWLVLWGALLCCLTGVLFPAYYACRLAPMDAIKGSNVQ